MAHFHGRMPHHGKVFADLNPVWGKFGNFTIRTVSETCCLILVPFIKTREWVLDVGYWQAGNVAFSVYPWSTDGHLAAQELTSAPTWAVLKNVPPQLYSLDGISVVASGIGEPLHTEKSRLDPYHLGDTKVKVEINLEVPPPEVVEVRDSVGNSVRIKVEYPRLPPKCLNCGRFGHLINRCMRPIQKGQKFNTQKRTGGLAVVKTSTELSSEETQMEESPLTISEPPETVADGTQGQSVRSKRRAQSRSARRARSRSRARGLSSPPELMGGEKKSKLAITVCGETFKDPDSPSKLRVGESLVTPPVSEIEEKIIAPNFRDGVEEDKVGKAEEDEGGVWLTVHSKEHRRALRQKALWEASAASFSPNRGLSLQTRGYPSRAKNSL